MQIEELVSSSFEQRQLKSPICQSRKKWWQQRWPGSKQANFCSKISLNEGQKARRASALLASRRSSVALVFNLFQLLFAFVLKILLTGKDFLKSIKFPFRTFKQRARYGSLSDFSIRNSFCDFGFKSHDGTVFIDILPPRGKFITYNLFHSFRRFRFSRRFRIVWHWSLRPLRLSPPFCLVVSDFWSWKFKLA